ncbi:MAG: DNA polymerase III subunit chi, partial [Desulfobulbaceae bacterium]|nr:DNA polymerase III subunit chi [Desulfobulbaceae bacterium]
ADAERLDELLWTFRDGSFVPHHTVSVSAGSQESPVTIGCGDDDIAPRDLLINLSDEVPAFAKAFPRVAELVTSDEDCKQLSRKRFAEYRDHGYTLETHNV